MSKWVEADCVGAVQCSAHGPGGKFGGLEEMESSKSASLRQKEHLMLVFIAFAQVNQEMINFCVSVNGRTE